MSSRTKKLALGASLAATVGGTVMAPAGAGAAPASLGTPVKASAPAAAPAAAPCSTSDKVRVDNKAIKVDVDFQSADVQIGRLELWYSANCRTIQTAVVMNNACGSGGDLGDAYCANLQLRQATVGTLKESKDVSVGNSIAVTRFYNDAGIQHYGKAIVPATAISAATTVTTIAY